MDRTRELPVEPLPLGDRGHRHVHGSKADSHRDEERGRGDAAIAMGGIDRERGEVAGYGGEKRDLRFGDGAPPGRPLAAEGEVVERDRLQVGPSIARTTPRPRALTYGNSKGEAPCPI
jgi:hypothetical protein